MGREFRNRYVSLNHSTEKATIGSILDENFSIRNLTVMAISKNATIQSAQSFLMGFNNFGFTGYIGNESYPKMRATPMYNLSNNVNVLPMGAVPMHFEIIPVHG